jgi:hypothetical protein
MLREHNVLRLLDVVFEQNEDDMPSVRGMPRDWALFSILFRFLRMEVASHASQ